MSRNARAPRCAAAPSVLYDLVATGEITRASSQAALVHDGGWAVLRGVARLRTTALLRDGRHFGRLFDLLAALLAEAERFGKF